MSGHENGAQSAENDAPCDAPGCGLPAVALVANDESPLSPDYVERYVCRWHRNNPPFDSSVIPPAEKGGE